MLKFLLKSRRTQTKIDSLLKYTVPLDDSSLKHLQGYYQAICNRHKIENPPQILVAPYLPMQAAAITERNNIVIGESSLSGMPLSGQLATIAHELAHVLRGDIGEAPKKVEYATDRLATAILGRKSPVANLIRKNAADFEQTEKIMQNSGINGKIIHYVDKLNLKRSYGTHKERLANILNSDLQSEETKLADLLEKRKKMGMAR